MWNLPTRQSRSRAYAACSISCRTGPWCAALPNGETLVIFCYHADWENKDLRVPGHGAVADILFSADDPFTAGRPLRHRLGPAPKDGEAVLLLEMGGVAITN